LRKDVQTFILPVRVYYEDTDAGGVVYYANYLKFMERARTEWLRARGFEQDELIKDQGVVFVVRSISVEYKKPARFNELLQVGVEIIETKRASITFKQLISRTKAPGALDVLTAGLIKVASLDVTTFRPKPIPLALSKDLERAD
jgi:acyl-CoA thioester hydrolase